ncbi:hypothetical protein D9758_007532 [Tetrapyrgos nigripes]|uniref:Uncharacterized protein n=1 Tax=Tetrapyrgos nigripes TaxID=182062 RepID=A0A8H5G3N9_9AGAR|nr:hypothetical protein D9758_007532 [Tetrapyrgos nigripes]
MGENSDGQAQQDRSVFSRIRTFNHHAFSSMNVFFHNPTPEAYTEEDRFDNDDDSITNQDVWDPAQDYFDSYKPLESYSPALTQDSESTEDMKLHETHTPTQSRPSTPQNRSFTASRLFYNFSLIPSRVFASHSNDENNCNRIHDRDEGIPLSEFQSSSSSLCTHEQINTSRPRLAPINTNLQYSGRPSNSNSSVPDDTPPLSPDASSSGLSVSSISTSFSLQDTSLNQFEDTQDRDGDSVYTPEHLQEVREGKKPERSICYDTSIDDLTDTNEPENMQTEIENSALDDEGEWYGLQYTLELSTKERRASEGFSYDQSMGEHSRSRESWAALHLGHCHPFFEDEEYQHWRNWHRFLDLQDERRRHRKGIEFKIRSKELAWCYMSEMKMRELMYAQIDVYGQASTELMERLLVVVEYRKDPYYPPQKHNAYWLLKRSRSVASLRELRPKPSP